MPEVLGQAAAYFDPGSVDSIVQSLDQILEDSEYREALIRRGTQHLKDFSWSDMARQTLAVYKAVGK
jgi:glycosyltransferase involved in cell wall biosynthesis